MNSQKTSRILVVADDPNHVDALYQMLHPAYEVLTAKTGQAALEKARKHLPNLILLDTVLPDISGFQVLSAFKDSEDTRKIPIIFLTDSEHSTDEERGLLFGAADYVTKPLHRAHVCARVRSQLLLAEYGRTIERLCRVDTLTGIPNLQHFDTQLSTEWDRAAREGESLALLLLDIDGLKGYNATHGQAQGDVLVKAVAAVLEQSICRPADFVARLGGGRFAILLPNTNTDGGFEVAGRIRAQVASTPVPGQSGVETGTTVSIGIAAELPSKTRCYEDLLSDANGALSRAKDAGRNCVCR